MGRVCLRIWRALGSELLPLYKPSLHSLHGWAFSPSALYWSKSALNARGGNICFLPRGLGCREVAASPSSHIHRHGAPKGVGFKNYLLND